MVLCLSSENIFFSCSRTHSVGYQLILIRCKMWKMFLLRISSDYAAVRKKWFSKILQAAFYLGFTKNINCFLNILNVIRCTFNTKIPQSNIFQREIQLSIWNEILRKSEKEINLHHLPLFSLTWMRKCSPCPKRMSRSVYFIVYNNQIYWWWHVLISTQADFQTISLCNFSLQWRLSGE